MSPLNGDLIVIYVEIPSLVINCIVPTTAIFSLFPRSRRWSLVQVGGQKNLNLPKSVYYSAGGENSNSDHWRKVKHNGLAVSGDSILNYKLNFPV